MSRLVSASRLLVLVLCGLPCALGLQAVALAGEKSFRAGAAAVDITPQSFPVIVNGSFVEQSADRAHDRLHARAIALDDGSTRLAIVIVDNLMMPRELLDEAKARASRTTSIPVERMLIAATHTHSAPSAMGCLGSRPDPHYPAYLVPQLARAIELAVENLRPARVGWTSVQAAEHTHCRRWILRPDRLGTDPFGEATVRANMHPGHQNPAAIGPSGPVDPELSLLAIQTADGRPLALLANYSMHYYGSPAVSADYFGRWAEQMEMLLSSGQGDSPVVAMMSQGTSGDQQWMDYGRPAERGGLDNYAAALARLAHEAYQKIQYHDAVPLAMAETRLTLQRRVASEERLQWARKINDTIQDRQPRGWPEIYAREQLLISQEPVRELKLQAIRIGEAAITAIPNEVYAITGLKLKAQSPFEYTFNIELANGAEGYIPPPEQHQLGGYTTWAARTAGLEVEAEPKIVAALVELLEQVAGKPRRIPAEPAGSYAEAVLASRPAAYWRLDEFAPPTANDTSGKHCAASYEDGIAMYLDGPQATGFHGGQGINRAVHFAGGRLKTAIEQLGAAYTVELWFWNGLPADARLVTGYFFSRGADGAADAAGDHLGIGGTHAAQGKLLFFNGNTLNQVLSGKSEIAVKSWNHVALVRDGKRVRVYLNGNPEPEIDAEADSGVPAGIAEVFIGGRNDNFANFAGKIDEVAIYDRALPADEVVAHFKAAHFQVAAAPASATAAPAIQPAEPLSPEQSLTAMHLREGFTVELMAAEPLVLDPVAIEWGADGKLWVVEMADYPLGEDGKMKPCGRVRYLEDSDGNGTYDKSTLFLEGVNFPNGIIPWNRGVLVTAAPEIFYAEDSNGDGRADVQRTLYKGFNPGNPQLRVNGLQWGLDGWLYCANGWSGGKIESLQTGDQIDINGRDFRIRPDEGLADAQAGVTEFGRNRDDWGNWFGCDNSNPLWHFVLEDSYTRRNPHAAPPAVKRQLITPTNPLVYALSESQKRYHSFDHSQRFTSACSAILYRDELLFARGALAHAFVCEPVHNMVHHSVVVDDGVSFQASRPDEERESEFLASVDQWFRPVMVRTGPDGALWVVDMYRYMIEHPDFLPPEGREELKPFFRLGEDRGRIYRIVPRGKKPRPINRLDRLDTSALVAALDSPNGWQRDTAQQLLLRRKDSAAVAPLKSLLSGSANPLARLQSLCTLDQLGVLDEATLLQALRDDHPGVRRQAVRLAEAPAAGSPQLVEAALKLVDDPEAKVRLQLACSLGAWSDARAAAGLARLAVRDAGEPYIVAAVLSSLNQNNVAPVVEHVLEAKEAGEAVLPRLVTQAVAFRQDAVVLAALSQLTVHEGRAELRAGQVAAIAAVLDALERQGRTVVELAAAQEDARPVAERVLALLKTAQAIVRDASADEAQRRLMIQLLARSKQQRQADLEVLAELLVPQTPAALQSTAIERLATQNQPQIAGMLLAGWTGHSPALKSQIITVLLSRDPWIAQLLSQIESQPLVAADLDAVARQRLVEHKNPEIRARAEKLLAISATGDRQQVVDQFRNVLELKGDLQRGAALFEKKCAGCHKVAERGYEVGPNLAALTDRSPAALLTAVLDPSRAVETRYRSYTAVTADGRALSGILASETGNSITLLAQDGKQEVILRSDLEQLQSSGKSLMPDGLEKDLSRQDLADLLEYVSRLKQ